MRKVVIALAVALGLAVVACCALVLCVPLLFEDRIASVAVGEANRQLRARVVIQDVDLGLLRTFPHLGLALQGVTVTGVGPFEGEPLAAVDRLTLVIDLMSALRGGPYVVRRLALDEPIISVVVDEEGRSNADILPESGESQGGGTLGLDLRAVTVTGGRLVYNDRKGHVFVSLEGLDHEGSGRLSDEVLSFANHTTVEALTFRDGAVTWLKGARLDLDMPIEIEQASGKVTLGQSRIALNDLRLGLAGTLEPRGEDLALGLGFEALDTDFASLLSLVPSVYTEDFADAQVAGTLACKGKVSGILPAEGDDLPGFDLGVQVKDGSFRMPDLPTGVEGVQLALTLAHPGGDPDRIAVDVERFAMTVAGSPLTGSLRLRHPVSDPDVAARVKGRVDLAALRRALPYEDVDYSGVLDVDLDVDGRLSQIEGRRGGDARAEGRFSLTDAAWKDPELPVPVQVQRLTGTLSPGAAVVDALVMTLGTSDLSASGRLDNLLGWFLKDEDLAGALAFRSNLLDTRPWLAEDGDDEDEGGSSLVAVPGNLDVTLDAEVGRLLYEDLELTDMKGRLRLHDSVATLQDVEFSTLGGRVTLDGTYTAPTARAADVEVEVQAVDFEVGKTAAAFETLRRVAPIAERATGRFSTGLRVQTRLDADLDPDLSSLFSRGRLSSRQLRIEPAFLAKLGDKLGNDGFGVMDLSGGQLDFTVRNGKVHLDPTTFAVAGAAATLSGTTGVLDQALDLTLDLQVPTGAIKASDVLTQLGGGQGGTIPLRVLVGGTFDKPTLRLSAPSAAELAAGLVAGAVGGRLAEAAGDLVAQAQAAGDKLVAEAEAQAQVLRDQAAKAGERLKDEAKRRGDELVRKARGNPIAEAAAEEAARKLRQEARQAAKKLEDEADAKGDALVRAAKDKRADMVARARAGGG